MTTDLSRQKSPEDLDVEDKRSELTALEARFSQCELALATAQAEMRTFERHYVKTMGGRFAELDQLQAEIAQIEATLHPHDSEKHVQAREARLRAEESAQATCAEPAAETEVEFNPSTDLRALYRRAALRIHPDLASRHEDRPHRERVMAAVNAAYESGDEERIKQILRDWESSPESVEGEGSGATLVRLIRKIAQTKQAIIAIEAAINSLQASDIFQLREKVRAEHSRGRDLLAEMAQNLDRKLRETRTRLLTAKASVGRWNERTRR